MEEDKMEVELTQAQLELNTWVLIHSPAWHARNFPDVDFLEDAIPAVMQGYTSQVMAVNYRKVRAKEARGKAIELRRQHEKVLENVRAVHQHAMKAFEEARQNWEDVRDESVALRNIATRLEIARKDYEAVEVQLVEAVHNQQQRIRDHIEREKLQLPIRFVTFLSAVIYGPMLRMQLMTFDCSHRNADLRGSCILYLDIYPEITCFDNPWHSTMAVCSCLTLSTLLPAVIVARTWFQLLEPRQSILLQPRHMLVSLVCQSIVMCVSLIFYRHAWVKLSVNLACAVTLLGHVLFERFVHQQSVVTWLPLLAVKITGYLLATLLTLAAMAIQRLEDLPRMSDTSSALGADAFEETAMVEAQFVQACYVVALVLCWLVILHGLGFIVKVLHAMVSDRRLWLLRCADCERHAREDTRREHEHAHHTRHPSLRSSRSQTTKLSA